MRTLTSDQCRRLDRQATQRFGIPSIVLMENAGRGTTDVLIGLGVSSPVVICCGKGNNAGDGFVVARHLDLRGIGVRVLLWCEPASLQGDAQINFEILQRAGIAVLDCANGNQSRSRQILNDATWIVDALLGTGIEGAPRAPLDDAIDQINQAAAPVLAVDSPSGLNCDTGACPGAFVRATHTCTFVAAKTGFFAGGVDQITGQLHVLDIGAPRKLVDEILAEGQGG